VGEALDAATAGSPSPVTDGTQRTATYQITPPGGTWDSADVGTYTVLLEANQASDTVGNKVAASTRGTFAVNLIYRVYLPFIGSPGP
jgi:hypothetical protein